MTEWNALPEALQLHLAAEALELASRTLAQHAECLAGEIEAGSLADKGGPDALRLLAAIVREIARTAVPAQALN
jgi:hypothetical protein